MLENLRRYSKKQITFFVSALILLLLILLKVTVFSKSSPAAARRGDVQTSLPVAAIIVTEQKFEETVRTTGTLQPNEEVVLQSEIAGKIEQIYFKEGKNVRKGQLLVKINDSELQAQLQRSKLELKLAEDTEFRQRKQLEIRAISQEMYDQTLNKLNTLKAEVALIDAKIEKTEIRAPFDGKIGLRYVSSGGIISANTRIASLIDDQPLKIEFAVPEKYSNQVGVGNKVLFRVQDNNKDFTAEIYALEPKIDPNTRTLTMRAIYNNEAQEITPGAFAEVQLVIGKKNQTIMVPTETIIPEMGGSKIFLLKNGTAVAANVETGYRTSRLIEITTGLQPGDTVITTGLLQLRTGMAVRLDKISESL
jgi:membrane fusion protein (multidrug efflux system)